jgi:hypothetical protein
LITDNPGLPRGVAWVTRANLIGASRAVVVALWLAEGFEFHQLRGFGVHAAPPEGLGLGLGATYATWILIMAALYPAC